VLAIFEVSRDGRIDSGGDVLLLSVTMVLGLTTRSGVSLSVSSRREWFVIWQKPIGQVALRRAPRPIFSLAMCHVFRRRALLLSFFLGMDATGPRRPIVPIAAVLSRHSDRA